jgi:ribose/xylose/arabinose/galactoside ABC-type transport system permease subunit
MKKTKFSAIHLLRGIAGEHAIAIALFAFWAILLITNPAFRNFSIYATILKEASIYAVVGVGMTFAIASGDFDLSVASQIALSSVAFTAILPAVAPGSPILAILLSCLAVLALGAAMGLFNGVLIARVRIPAFIATLATQNVYRGLAQLANDSPVAIATLGKGYLPFTSGAGAAARLSVGGFDVLYVKGFAFTKILGLPLFFYIMAALAALGTLILRKTKTGRDVLAIGNSKPAARIAGIDIPLTQIKIYAVVGLFTALAALMMTSNQGSSNYGVPTGTEFTVISAVVLGGTALAGGKGSILNTVIAAVFIATISTALTTFGVDNNIHGVFRGAIHVFAFSINTVRAYLSDFWARQRARREQRGAAASQGA